MEAKSDQVGVFVVCRSCGGEIDAAQLAGRDPERPFRCDACSLRQSDFARQVIQSDERSKQRAKERVTDDNRAGKPTTARRVPSRDRTTKQESPERTLDDDDVRGEGDVRAAEEEHGGKV